PSVSSSLSSSVSSSLSSSVSSSLSSSLFSSVLAAGEPAEAAGEGKTKEASVGEDRERSEEAKSSEERGDDAGLGASRDEEAKPVEREAREALQTVGDMDAERDVDGKEADRTKQDRRGKEEETEYPHYREDAQGEAIRHTLEKSVIGVRVAVEASPVGASRRAREGWRRPASRHEAGALPLPNEQHITFFKLRPGCLDFLRRVSQTFELYMYTMGTALHAATALRILDPKRRFFGRRVFSRQDAVNGLKAIERIFPHDQKMVLVVDDLECMWSYSPCCIKVQGYHYFADVSAADARRISPHSYTQWLSMARPFCNFLPSGRPRPCPLKGF
ncbi:NLI interacting factor family phosphatase, partial [Toxoplasma gondii GAB2-2007-GAL-DOM2]